MVRFSPWSLAFLVAPGCSTPGEASVPPSASTPTIRSSDAPPVVASPPDSLVEFTGPRVAIHSFAATPWGFVLTGWAPEGLPNLDADSEGPSGSFVLGLGPEGDVRWKRWVEGPTSMLDGIAVLDDGHVIVTGFFGDTMTLGDHVLTSRGGLDGIGIRFTAEGRIRWLHDWGGHGRDYARGLTAAREGRAWLTGAFEDELIGGMLDLRSLGSTDVLLIELDVETGRFLDALAFGSHGEDFGRALAWMPDGGLVVTGAYGSNFGPDGPLTDDARELAMHFTPELALAQPRDFGGFVVRLGPDLEPLWATAIDHEGFDVVKDVLPVPAGVAIVGAGQRQAPPPGVPGLMADDTPLSGMLGLLDPASGKMRWEFAPSGLLSLDSMAFDGSSVHVVGHSASALSMDGRSLAGPRGDSGLAYARVSLDGAPLDLRACDGPGADQGRGLVLDGTRVWVAGNGSGTRACSSNDAGAGDLGFVVGWDLPE